MTAAPRQSGKKIEGILIGTLVAVDGSGRPRIDFPAKAPGRPMPACSVVPLNEADVGRNVAITFERGNPRKPLILGLIQQPVVGRPHSAKRGTSARSVPFEVEADGQRLVIAADEEIVIRCGEASITLTRAGKVLIGGTYLLSRSSGVNKIQGGSIQLN